MVSGAPRPIFVEVCGVEDVWDGEMECFSVGDTAILLLKLDGQFHAYQARCPHQGAALVEGRLDGSVLTCRAHHWQFDAASGEGINPRKASLKHFPAEIADGKVRIGIIGGIEEGGANTTDPSCVLWSEMIPGEMPMMTDDASGGGRSDNLVGPVLRVGDLADAVARAIEEDNPGKQVRMVERGDYVRIHTEQECRLTKKTLERQLGHPYDLPLLEIDMPSFSGRLATRADAYVWYYRTGEVP
jgi:nitrite reductase/ring-hydroxylating ferredoxin subunit